MDHEFDDFEQNLRDIEDELEEFESELEELDDESDDLPVVRVVDLTEVEVRTVVLSKKEMIALLCLKTAKEGGEICRVDPRDPSPAIQIYDDREAAVEWFTRALGTSRKNGWNVVYDGLPLRG